MTTHLKSITENHTGKTILYPFIIHIFPEFKQYSQRHFSCPVNRSRFVQTNAEIPCHHTGHAVICRPCAYHNLPTTDLHPLLPSSCFSISGTTKHRNTTCLPFFPYRWKTLRYCIDFPQKFSFYDRFMTYRYLFPAGKPSTHFFTFSVDKSRNNHFSNI